MNYHWIRTETEHHSLTENDEKGWKHSGEFRKVTAWLGRSEIDMGMRGRVQLYGVLQWKCGEMSDAIPVMPTPIKRGADRRRRIWVRN